MGDFNSVVDELSGIDLDDLDLVVDELLNVGLEGFDSDVDEYDYMNNWMEDILAIEVRKGKETRKGSHNQGDN